MSIAFILLVNLIRLLRNTWRSLFKKPPDYVWIEVSGDLPEFERRMGFLRRRLTPGPAPQSLERIRGMLDRTLADGRVKGVVLRVQSLSAGWTALEELRRDISDFRERGGRAVAYLVEADSGSYYLACAADEIFATPLSTLGIVGLRTRVNFLKDALARTGIEAEVIAVSPYKSAGDIFARNDFSKESREQAERLLEGRFKELVDAISRGRKIPAEEVRAKIDRAPYDACRALDAGLLDGVCYEDELPEKLGTDENRAKLAEWGDAQQALKVPYRRAARQRVGLVSLSGTIVRGRSRRLPLPLPLLGSEQAGSESILGALRAAEKNRRVAAILFHVDSGGGDALASDLIWREVERIRRKKPVVVLMGSAAASGGYYVSAAANHIVARRTTITGSIGVLITRPVATRLYGRLGVNPVSLERGARAGIFDESRRPAADELEVLEEQLRSIYDEFKDRVVRGRGIEVGALESIAGGRVWNGAEARERGLVDELGGFASALRKAAELGGIERLSSETLLKISPPRNSRPTPGELAEVLEVVRASLSDLRAGGVWAARPYEISDGW